MWNPAASLVFQVPQVYNQSLPLDPSVWTMELTSMMEIETTVFFKTCFRSKCLICGWNDLSGCIIYIIIPWLYISTQNPSVSHPKLGEDILRQKSRWTHLKLKRWRLKRERDIYIYTWNPKHPVLNGCLVKQPFFYVMIWNHPIETTIYKWMFQVPGI